MLSSSRARALLLGGLIAIVLGVVLAPTDEKRVRAVADSLVEAANESPVALARALQDGAVPNVALRADELAEPLIGRAALVEAARRMNEGVKGHVAMEGGEVRVEGQRARMTVDLVASQAEVPELRRPRPTVLLFQKRGRSFQLVSAEIGAPRRDQPEARP